jgi:D-cysteine desulfhydrase
LNSEHSSYQDVIMFPNEPKRAELARLPTPIHILEKMSRLLGGPELYVKRDDLTGIGLSGNKIRKLEYLLADAREQGADTLITCGGIQSNHARATAVAAVHNGMRAVLVLRGESDTPYDGNVLLDRLVNAEIRLVTSEEYRQRIGQIMWGVAEELRGKGRRPYIIPEGGSNSLGVWGYIRAAYEIKEQLEEMGEKINTIVTAVGSGGSYAGLSIGRKMAGLPTRIVGFNVCETAEHFQDLIGRLAAETVERYRLQIQLKDNQIDIIDGYVGRGYALSRPEELELIRAVAREEGIFLDPVYTGKAFLGLADQIRLGRFGPGQKVLFLHTGGIFGLFTPEKRKGLFPEQA